MWHGVRCDSLLNAACVLATGLADVLDKNVRNMARGEAARAYLRRHWVKPTLLLFGAPVRPAACC